MDCSVSAEYVFETVSNSFGQCGVDGQCTVTMGETVVVYGHSAIQVGLARDTPCVVLESSADYVGLEQDGPVYVKCRN
jgi:hypothetical protein